MNHGRAAFIVGHDEKKKGAKALPPLDCYEYDFNTEIGNLILAQAKNRKIQVRVFTRNRGLEQCYREVDEWTKDVKACAIELHFNAAENPNARGTETLYDSYPSQSAILAELVQGEVLKAIHYDPGRTYDWRQTLNRKAKLLKQGDRGHYQLSLAKIPSVIVEPFFGTNALDVKQASIRKKEYAIGLLLAAESFLRVF